MIIKPYQPKTLETEALEHLLTLKLTAPQKQKVLTQLKILRAGEAGEKEAAFQLNQEYQDKTNSILLHDVRFECEGEAIQIDHLAINYGGTVTLYETKNFAKGIKVDKKGQFQRYDASLRAWVDFKSPIKQSERHARVLKKIFEDLRVPFQPNFRHFVIVSYGGLLEKPAKGFENVCRPDAINEAMMETKLTAKNVMTAFRNLYVGTLSEQELKHLGEKLLALHQPHLPDYAKWIGLDALSSQPEQAEQEKAAKKNPSKERETPSEHPAKRTTSVLAKQAGLSVKEALSEFEKLGYLYQVEGEYQLTEKGIEMGAEKRKGRYTDYFLWPNDR